MEKTQALALFDLAPDSPRDALDSAYRRHLNQLRRRLREGDAGEVQRQLQSLRRAFLSLQESLPPAQAAAESMELPAHGESLQLMASFAAVAGHDDRYRGEGEIGIHPRQGILTVRGKRQPWLWPRREFFPLASVRNPRLEDKTVYFTLPLSPRRHWHAVLTCPSAAAAQALWRALPEHIDPGLEEEASPFHKLWNRGRTLNPAASLALLSVGMLAYLLLGISPQV